MSIRSLWKARGPFVLALVIIAFLYIGFQLIVDLGWLTLDELIRDLAGIAGVVVLVIISAIIGAVVLILRGAQRREQAAERWQALNKTENEQNRK